MQIDGLLQRNFVELNIEVFRFSRLHAQLMLAIPGLCHVDRAGLENTTALTGFRLKLFVNLDGVILKFRNVVIVMQTVDTGSGMPG